MTDLTSDIVCGPAAAAITITGCFLIGIATVIVSAVTLFRIKRLDTFQVQDDDTPQSIEMRILKYVQPTFFVFCGFSGVVGCINAITQCAVPDMDPLAANILFWISATVYNV